MISKTLKQEITKFSTASTISKSVTTPEYPTTVKNSKPTTSKVASTQTKSIAKAASARSTESTRAPTTDSLPESLFLKPSNITGDERQEKLLNLASSMYDALMAEDTGDS